MWQRREAECVRPRHQENSPKGLLCSSRSMVYRRSMAVLVPIAVIVIRGKAARVSMPMAAVTMVEAHTAALEAAAPDVQRHPYGRRRRYDRHPIVAFRHRCRGLRPPDRQGRTGEDNCCR